MKQCKSSICIDYYAISCCHHLH